MAGRKIVWTTKANIERQDILHYWIMRNKSKNYSIKLNKLFIETLNVLSVHPNLGRKTDASTIRVKIVRDYLIFYKVNKEELIVLSVWDSRRDDKKLSLE